ncbi:hypothetical protein L798_13381 [Zootermopsis nevadensis]|uniref:Uncharacterized protein n=1 Tax=Zootermopsis nevadensis TaxID=136037 RepID=A0A067QQG5_ZOONE|nr:hypothetical protein L798_13381 [Zootermopsis nevadensis]
MRWAGHVARMDGTRGVHRVLIGTPEGKRPLGRPRRRWENNVRRDLWEIRVEGDWILLAQDRVRWRALVNSVMNLRLGPLFGKPEEKRPLGRSRRRWEDNLRRDLRR